MRNTRIVFALIFLITLFIFSGYADAQMDCMKCHKHMVTKKFVHAAFPTGCKSCHSEPHQRNSKFPKGLSAAIPDLCYNCHGKTKFSKKNVHAPVAGGMCLGCHDPHTSDYAKLLIGESPDLCFTCHDKKGFSGEKIVHSPVAGGMCTTCHNDPHSSNTPKLLSSELPVLCFNCHDKTEFSKKNVHAPVAGGMCLSCHKPHVSEHIALLTKEPVNVCLECHEGIKKKPHVIVSFSTTGHPIGVQAKDIADPARQGRKFDCGSCHNPHSSESPGLFRYKADSSFQLCAKCHKK